MEVVETNVFDKWLKGLKGLKDRREPRLDRSIVRNCRDVKPIGGGISGLRIDYGPGWR